MQLREWAKPVCVWLAVGVLAVAAPAAANDVDVSVDAKAYVGNRPKLKLKVNKPLVAATLDVRGVGGLSHRQRLGPAAAGGELVYELPQAKIGQVKWAGTLSVEFEDGSTGSMPLTFATEVVGKITFELKSQKDEILANNEVKVTMSAPAGKVDVEVWGDDGEMLANVSVPFHGEAPGTVLTAGWLPKTSVKPLEIKIVVWDTDGIFSPTLAFFPWSLDIEHDDVVFDTGKSVIRPDQEPKLVAALDNLNKELTRYKKALERTKDRVRFYVIGHTDTVGSSSSNAALSHARAIAIATWFKKKGVKLPIYARGVGEEQLKVETPDETDNAENRRAEYRVANDEPIGGLGGWQKVN